MARKNIQKLLKQMKGGRKKKLPTKSSGTLALEGRKHFSRGSEKENSMVKEAQRNYTGSYVHGDLGGVNVGNKSLQAWYSNPGFKMPKI